MSYFSKTIYIRDNEDLSYEYKGLHGCAFQSYEKEPITLGSVRYIGGFLCYAYTRYKEKVGWFTVRYKVNWIPARDEDFKLIECLFEGKANNG